MVTSVNQGYLDAPYLSNAYLGESDIQSRGIQFSQQISPVIRSVSVSWVNETRMSQPGSVQASLYILDKISNRSVQYNQVIHAETKFGLAFTRFLLAQKKSIGFQTARFIKDKTKSKSLEFRVGKLRHEISTDKGGYMSGPYLSYTPYLAPYIQVSASAQFKSFITQKANFGLQFKKQLIGVQKTEGLQFKKQIAKVVRNVGLAFEALQGRVLGLQFTQALYNTNRLRVLADFPSRGMDGYNWLATSYGGTDFDVNNLNSDIPEQVYRTNVGDKSTVISCDTQIPQGAFVDTFAMLNHNLTTSASIVLQGSNDSNFVTAPFSQTLYVMRDNKNIFWISPGLPTAAYRYWRLIISDTTNTQSFLEIGCVMFGSSIIMTDENFVDRLTRKTIHFADKVETEGFTNVSNDRALKYAVSLEFRNLNYSSGNYRKLRGIFDTARTSLKCLWIPDPRKPERFAVFGKLTEIPDEEHNYVSADADYISMSVQVDESL